MWEPGSYWERGHPARPESLPRGRSSRSAAFVDHRRALVLKCGTSGTGSRAATRAELPTGSAGILPAPETPARAFVPSAAFVDHRSALVIDCGTSGPGIRSAPEEGDATSVAPPSCKEGSRTDRPPSEGPCSAQAPSSGRHAASSSPRHTQGDRDNRVSYENHINYRRNWFFGKGLDG